MRIKKYQSGGIAYLPTVNRFLEGAAQTAASSSNSSSESSKVPGFAKEIISLIKENGIESDVDVFLNSLQRTLDVAGDPSGENLSMRDILRVLKDVNRVKQNHAQYVTAEKSLEAQDAWAEPATDARGYLYVMDSDRKVSRIHPSQYDPEKYVSLTNLDLMHIRQIDPSKAYDSEILKNLSSAVGMKTISDYARSIIKDFGKTDITGYSEKTAGKIKSGMDKIVGYGYDELSKLLFGGPDGVYKTNKQATIADEDIRLALDYLKSSLPNSFHNTLNAKATAEGYNPDLMLITMLRADTDRKISVDYDQTASADAGVGRAGAKEAEEKLNDHDTYLQRIAAGGEWTKLPIIEIPNDPTETSAYIAVASDVGELLDSNMHRLEIGNLNSIFNKLEAVKATISKDVTFGDQLLNPGERGAVIWDGESQLTDIWLPFKNEGGQIKPDFDKLRAFNTFNKKLRENPNISNYEKVQLMRSYGLRPEELIPTDQNYTSFEFKESAMKMFLSFSGIVNEKNIDLTEDSRRMLLELDGDTKSRFKDLYNNAVKYNTISRSKSTKAVNSAFKTGRRGDYYRGNVYIPIDSQWLALHSSRNQNVPKSDNTRWAARTQAAKVISQSKNSQISTFGQF